VARLGQEFRLGRNCSITIDNWLIVGIEDLTVRVVQREIDATEFGSCFTSSVVTHRGYEVSFTSPDYKVSQFMRARLAQGAGVQDWGDKNPQLPWVARVEFFHGVWHGVKKDFIVHELDSDEPLNGAVRARFLLKQVTT
jgi:hypothetical protein